jgi:hypothetical protein
MLVMLAITLFPPVEYPLTVALCDWSGAEKFDHNVSFKFEKYSTFRAVV